MTDPKTVETIAKGLEESFSVLRNVLAHNHGSLRGTAEAVLAEAQGMRITDSANPNNLPKYHLNSLQNDVRALQNSLTKIGQLSGKLKSENKEIYHRLWKASQDVRSLAQSRITVLRQVEHLAYELQKAGHHNRLSGMSRVIMTGARDMRSLVSSQLDKMGNVRLLPPIIARDFQALMSRIRSLPVSPAAAMAQVTAAMASLKAAMESVAFRAAMTEFFGIFSRLFMSIFRVVPIIIIPPGYYQNRNPGPPMA